MELSCSTLCDPADCSMLGFSVLCCLPEFTEIRGHRVGDAIQPSRPLPPLLLWPFILPSIRVFSSESALPSGGQSIGVSASASLLPMNMQGWFPLGLSGRISLQSTGLSRVLSSTAIQKHHFLQRSVFFMVQLSHLYMTTGKAIALTRWIFVGHIEMSPLFTPLSGLYGDLAITPRLATQWVQGLRLFFNKLL